MSSMPDDRSFQHKLQELGYIGLDEACVADALKSYRELKSAQPFVDDEEIEGIVDDVVAERCPRIRFVSVAVQSGSVQRHADARVELEVDGAKRTAQAHSDGPVHAAFNAIRTIVPHAANLHTFSISAAGPGPDAVAIASLKLEEHGRIVEGRGEDVDTLVASTKALVNALNKLAAKTEQSVHLSPAFLTA